MADLYFLTAIYRLQITDYTKCSPPSSSTSAQPRIRILHETLSSFRSSIRSYERREAQRSLSSLVLERVLFGGTVLEMSFALSTREVKWRIADFKSCLLCRKILGAVLRAKQLVPYILKDS